MSHDAHHAHCQDESRDPDLWVQTVMSLTPGSASRKTGLGRALWEAELRNIFSAMSPRFVAHVTSLIDAHDAKESAS